MKAPNSSDEVEFKVGNYFARLVAVTDSVAFNSCLRLRYGYFVEERGWVKHQPEHPGLECDHYDGCALHLAVFDGDIAIAYLRLLPYRKDVGFMLTHEFQSLVGGADYFFMEENSVELSRLVCQRKQSNVVSDKDSSPPMDMLLKLLYRVAQQRRFSRFFIVVEETWIKPFVRRFGLPFQIIGEPYIFPDGTRTVAAVATLDELEAGMKQHSIAKYEWYRQFPELTESPK